MNERNEKMNRSGVESSVSPDRVTISQRGTARRRKQQKNRAKEMTFMILRRTLLMFFTIVLLLVIGLCLILNLIFNGPAPATRDILTMSLLEASATKWVPGLFIGSEAVDEIRYEGKDFPNISMLFASASAPQVNPGGAMQDNNGEWKDFPDGVYIEEVKGATFNAYVMVTRDPSKVYMATSSTPFSKDKPGLRINEAIKKEGAIAAINAGAFFDNGSASAEVGSVPEGLVIAGGEVLWTSGRAPENGFIGFTYDNVMVVDHSMTAKRAKELNIRDGCCFGPALIINGQTNLEAYNSASGLNPRTAIGQRADGAVIFVCIDGRQAGSLGGTYADVIDIMTKYGAVNACNLDGGSSTVMLYEDQYGRYDSDTDRQRFDDGKYVMINNYSLLQEQPRRMPTFFMVRPADED
jgi:exopolysaccharide biosynthesis protein